MTYFVPLVFVTKVLLGPQYRELVSGNLTAILFSLYLLTISDTGDVNSRSSDSELGPDLRRPELRPSPGVGSLASHSRHCLDPAP